MLKWVKLYNMETWVTETDNEHYNGSIKIN